MVDVFLRIRPQNPREQGEPPGVLVRGNAICVDELQASKRQWFDFEGIVDSRNGDSDQHKVFEAVGENAVKSVLDGFDTCVFSLGQTGTGKTFTLVGSQEEPGLLPRAVERLLGETRCCRLSCLELHMDRVRDLLAVDSLEIRNQPEIRCVPGRGVYVSHLTEVVTRDVDDAIKHIHAAARSRAVARTGMNACSSRGHAVFQISLEDGARLCVVDLAGRENEKTSGCSGQSLAELSYINRSLFHLTNVIQALAATPGTKSPRSPRSQQSRVPFRDSKLTLLLSEYLRTARTFLVATASPAASGIEETLATLRLAQAVRQITTRSRRSESKATSVAGSPASTVRTPRAPASARAKLAGGSAPKPRGGGGGGSVVSEGASTPAADLEAEMVKAFLEHRDFRPEPLPDGAGTPSFGGAGGSCRALFPGARGVPPPSAAAGAAAGCISHWQQKDEFEAIQRKAAQAWRSSAASVSSQATRATNSKAATDVTTDSDRCSEESLPGWGEACHWATTSRAP